MGKASSAKRDKFAELNSLVIALPCGELGYSSFWRKLVDRRSPNHEDFGYMAMTGRVVTNENGYLHGNHYALAQMVMKIPGAKRVVFLEHDHEFPVGFLRKHANYTHPMVGGLYVVRDITEPLPVVYRWDAKRENVELYNAVESNEMLTHRGLYPVDVVPLGCTSVDIDVFRNWPKDQPIFSSYVNPAGGIISLDVFFCRMAQDKMDIQPMIDTTLSVTHYLKVPFDDSLFIKWWNRVGAAQAVARAKSEAQSANGKAKSAVLVN